MTGTSYILAENSSDKLTYRQKHSGPRPWRHKPFQHMEGNGRQVKTIDTQVAHEEGQVHIFLLYFAFFRRKQEMTGLREKKWKSNLMTVCVINNYAWHVQIEGE